MSTAVAGALNACSVTVNDFSVETEGSCAEWGVRFEDAGR